MMRESKGNMYDWLSHTWNAIKGKCPHDCSYCYMKVFKLKEVRLDEYELKTDLGKGNFIFVGSSCDMFADGISFEWIIRVLNHCKSYKENKYLFQSKNPKRIFDLKQYLPKESVIGTTIETNKYFKQMGVTPSVASRSHYIGLLSEEGFETMVTIEPILDFDLNKFVALIKSCKPTWVNIGADSKGHNLPEPSKAKVLDLICELEKFTEIKKKNNLARLGVG